MAPSVQGGDDTAHALLTPISLCTNPGPHGGKGQQPLLAGQWGEATWALGTREQGGGQWRGEAGTAHEPRLQAPGACFTAPSGFTSVTKNKFEKENIKNSR